MRVVLGTIQFLLIIIICANEFKKRSVSIFLWATLLIMFGIMHFITCFIPNYNYSTNTINVASAYVIIFEVLYLIMRRILTSDKNINVIRIVSDCQEYTKNEKKFFGILSILLVIVILTQIFILINGAGGINNTSWINMRNSTSGKGYFSYSQMFTTLFFTTSASILIAFVIKDKKKFLILIGLVILEVLISRNRIEVLPLICTIITIYISKISKLKLKQIIILLVLAILVIYIIYGLRAYRFYGTMGDFLRAFEFGEFNNKINSSLKTDDGELGLRKYFYYFIENNNKFDDFGEGNTYKRMLLAWLPTSWSMGLKPDDFAISMGKAVNPKIKGFSVHPTLFGDCYANFGFIGSIFMGIFWAIYVSIIDTIIKKQKSKIFAYSLISICSIIYVIIGRGSVYNGFVWQCFGIMLLFASYFLACFKIKKNNYIDKGDIIK